ncbi:hypothetical protein CVT25_001327 [Psilocybe cyanescens]|uniref:Uncharacterized protein n=1 Tax=Psilocybe cyanescens TaxID=93625 RepID=A0A409XEN4_PSICY|nr:hypothetical protein CVT25_001327 [Psilocybe cyanescens]
MHLAIRSQCVHFARTRFKSSTLNAPLQQRRPFSGTSHARHGAVVPFSRSAHSIVDPPASKDFPINVIETQQSIRALSALVEQGKLDKARQVLADILDRIPADGEVDVYRQVKHVIAPQDAVSPAAIDLIMQLGLASASRGYSHFTREEVLPLLVESELHSQVERELETAESAPSPINRVFEDTSDDYVVPSEPAPVRPSVMDLIEAQLPALLPEPTQGDASIFEEEEIELLDSTPAHPSEHIHNTSIGLLDKTLLAGLYEDAYKLLLDMCELGVHIPPHPKYAYVALSILQSNKHLSVDQTDRFIAWLNLIPPVNKTTPESWEQVTSALSKIEQHFLQDETPDIPVATRKIVLLASKGYVDRAQRLIDVVVRSLGAARLMPYVEQVEEAFTEYTVNEKQPLAKLFRAKSIFRNKVLTALVFSMRADEAVPLLDMDGSWALHKLTTKLLVGAAKQRSPDAPLARAMAFLGKDVAPSELYKHTIEPPVDFHGDLVLGAKYLKAMLATRARVPHSGTIATFLALYLATGRTRIARTLFDRAHRSTLLNSKCYTLAEMLFYHQHRLYDLVIETFVEHFYLFGVDRRLVLERYAAHRARRAERPHLPVRFHYSARTAPFAGKKLFPENYHRTLLWHALIRTTPPPQRKHVYLAFLAQAQAHRAVLAGDRFALRTDGAVGAYSVKSRFSSSSFTPFFDPMMRRYGATAGHRIMRDILDLGLAPHIYVYTELAKFYSRADDAARVFEIVDRLEAGESFKYQPPARGEAFQVLLPSPDLAFYIAILRGFVMNRNVEAAERVVERITRVFYDARTNYPFYAEALEDLEGLKTHGDAWMPPLYRSEDTNSQIENEIGMELQQ